MKKIYNKKITVAFISVILLLIAMSVYAECLPTGIDTVTGKVCYIPLKYIPLESGAFTETNTPIESGNLTVFLGQVFKFGIAAAVALAFVMIIWGGIIKMTTDSWSKQDEAKSKITNAIYGLGLALISWVLLYTINPNLVNFSGENNALLSTSTPQTIPTSKNP